MPNGAEYDPQEFARRWPKAAEHLVPGSTITVRATHEGTDDESKMFALQVKRIRSRGEHLTPLINLVAVEDSEEKIQRIAEILRACVQSPRCLLDVHIRTQRGAWSQEVSQEVPMRLVSLDPVDEAFEPFEIDASESSGVEGAKAYAIRVAVELV